MLNITYAITINNVPFYLFLKSTFKKQPLNFIEKTFRAKNVLFLLRIFQE